ncbi:MAG: nucleotide exchange factor GrpE [Holosporales bacterium]|jgi:molecular chaperone GrpE|nr:nucleotide exchange factor GrpE [Holosporales bacterium]
MADRENEAADGDTVITENDELAEKVAALEDKLLRAIAESQNLQKRAEKERSDILKYGIAAFAKDVISIRDNLLRAIENCPPEESLIVDGIKLTLAEMDKILTRHCITMIESAGKIFDPHLHQAIAEVEDSDAAPGTITKVMQEGFMIEDRLLRPALVCVAKK